MSNIVDRKETWIELINFENLFNGEKAWMEGNLNSLLHLYRFIYSQL